MKASGFAVIVALAIAVLSSEPAAAAVTTSFSLPVARAPHPLPLDPSLSDPAWAAGLVPNGKGPWQNVTTRGPAAQQTTVYMLYDDTALYIGFKAEQTGIPIVATQTTNDVGFGQDDFVGFGVDTSGAGSQAYLFETTPKGVRYEQANENVRYRPRWASAAAVSGGTWSAVLIVPLSVLRVPHAGAQNWRLQFVRGIAAKGEHLVWAWDPLMQDQVGANWPAFQDSRWWAGTSGITLKSIGKARGGARADIYGLASVGVDRDLFQQADGQFLPMKVRPYGIDVSYPITPTISFVGTANPDFSNVEVDQQTIAPQEFRRQLIEYRPFFAQGANFINADSGARSPTGGVTTAPSYVFYSPDIGPFDWGTKIEGTFGQQSLGALAFRGYDETTGNTFSDQAYGYEHATQGGTFIYWSDGVLAHHSIAGDDTTIEGGMEARDLKDGWVAFFDHSFENGSWVPQGSAGFTDAFIDRHKGPLEVNVGYEDVSPNYNPIDGFTPNSDIRGPVAFVNYIGSMPGVKSYGFFAAFDRLLDQSGAVHQADSQVFLNATFNNGFSIDGAGSGDRSTALVRHSGRPRLYRTDRHHVVVYGFPVLPRRRYAAVQSFDDPDRLPRRHTPSRRRELFVGAVRRQLDALIYDRDCPSFDTAPIARPGVRRHLRARVYYRHSRLAVAATRDPQLQPHERKHVHHRSAGHQRPGRLCDTGRKQPRRRVPRPVPRRKRTVYRLRHARSGCDN